jgi:hypothetical protein
MPQPAAATRCRPALAADEQFLALLCADEELLRAEFEAIIAAEWPTTPTRPPAGRNACVPPGGGARAGGSASTMPPPDRSLCPGGPGWVRQRSPPDRRAQPASTPKRYDEKGDEGPT